MAAISGTRRTVSRKPPLAGMIDEGTGKHG